jgi:hypothetical protein
LLCMLTTSVWAFRHAGRWLELNEPLQHAQAIVVLGGGLPFRPIEAAKLFQAGWAPQIWVTDGGTDAGDDALARIGIIANRECDRSQLIMQRMGVPAAAMHVVPGIVDNTESELRAISRYAGSSPVILVTSRYHARRVRVVWNPVARRSPMIVRDAELDPYNANRWWARTDDAIATSREIFGILNFYAGSPVRSHGH